MIPVILDLCGGSGAWSKPYVEAGYDVRLVTLPQDVRLVAYPGPVHGILAAPPCTIFSIAANRLWSERTPDEWREALSVVDACLRLVVACRPQWWALENPEGRLRRYLGKPTMTFQPWHYGHAYTKRTLLWGSFTRPGPTDLVQPTKGIADVVRDPARRAVTPAGFAQAFMRCNP